MFSNKVSFEQVSGTVIVALFQDLGRYCEIQNLLKTCKMCSVTSCGSCCVFNLSRQRYSYLVYLLLCLVCVLKNLL